MMERSRGRRPNRRRDGRCLVVPGRRARVRCDDRGDPRSLCGRARGAASGGVRDPHDGSRFVVADVRTPRLPAHVRCTGRQALAVARVCRDCSADPRRSRHLGRRLQVALAIMRRASRRSCAICAGALGVGRWSIAAICSFIFNHRGRELDSIREPDPQGVGMPPQFHGDPGVAEGSRVRARRVRVSRDRSRKGKPGNRPER
jgi:hypothetical protein